MIKLRTTHLIALFPLFILLSACRSVQYEGDIPANEGMDPGVRQIMMEEEYQSPQEEEGMIPAPSDQLRTY